ncbi:MAG: trimethylamine methyltransferase family protein [Candidatus Bathyarchaeia archaeon]
MIGFSRDDQKIKIRIFSRSELEAIHWATLDILERTGVKIYSEKCLKILEEAGCKVDYKMGCALIPSEVVEEALRKKKSVFRLCARNPKYDLKLDGRHVYITTDGNAVNTLDFETGERRASTKDDIAKSATIADALDSVGVYWPMVTSSDVPAPIRHLHDLEASLANTEKHVQLETIVKPKVARYAVEIAAAVVGDTKKLRERPIISSLHCTISPLQHEGGSIEAALEFAKAGIPVSFYGMPQAGATSPVTLAGAVVINNAEVLSGLVIVQLVHPGAPVIYGTGGAGFDMKAGTWTGGSPERALISAAAGELAKYYNMPSLVGGFVTSAKTIDAQACYEKLISGIPQVLSGCDIIAGIGLIDNCNTLSFEQLLIDDEIVNMTFRLVEGIEVKEQTIALDLIQKIGPGGNFLAEKHTLEYLQKEHFIPKLTDRRSYEAWLKNGAKDITKRAKEKVKTILQQHQPQPLPKETRTEIQNIIGRAEKDMI